MPPPTVSLPAFADYLRLEAERERQRGAAFLLETRAPAAPAEVGRVAKDRLGAACAVEPVFEPPRLAGDPFRLGSFFVARLPGLRFADLPQSPYDWAYAVRDRDDFFLSVEPDLTFPFRPPPDPDGFEAAAFPCFVDAGLAPADPADWALQLIGAQAGWDLPPPAGGGARGAGVRVGHLDTGRAAHAALPDDAFDPDGAFNFVEGNDDPTDPLEDTWLFRRGLENPGHGTKTGSVIAGRGPVLGVAPQARLVSIRCIRSVVVSHTAATVARAIQHAADAGCHVISMSLGGLPRRALQRAVEYAVANNVLVAAAAGNCVRVVVAPALYEACVAVAGVNRDRLPWLGSCRGGAVDLSAPGEFVPVAFRGPNDAAGDGSHLAATERGQGTSYAVAHVAGAAAAWLAFHGRDELLARYGGAGTLQDVFLGLLRTTAARHRGPNWDDANYGVGILNLRELLAEPLPPAGGFEAAAPLIRRDQEYFDLLTAALGVGPATQEAVKLFRLPGTAARRSLSATVEPFGAEVLDLSYRPGGRPRPVGGLEAVAAPDGAVLEEQIRAAGSLRLRSATRR